MKEDKRVIKFRAWDKDEMKMITHNIAGITQNNLGDSHSENLRILITVNGDYCLPNYGQNIVLMQFTGLLDKQGKEIYEGDVVQYETGDPEKPFIEEEVIYNEGAFYPVCMQPSDTFEIMGNVYEGSESLTPPTSKP